MKQIEWAKECGKANDAHKVALATIVAALIREGHTQYDVMKTANAFMEQICQESEIWGEARGEFLEKSESIDIEDASSDDVPI